MFTELSRNVRSEPQHESSETTEVGGITEGNKGNEEVPWKPVLRSLLLETQGFPTHRALRGRDLKPILCYLRSLLLETQEFSALGVLRSSKQTKIPRPGGARDAIADVYQRGYLAA